MIISDLSYMNETASNDVNGGTGFPGYRFQFDLDVTKDINVDIDVDINPKVKAIGSYTESTVDLQAVGPWGAGVENSLAQTSAYVGGMYVAAINGATITYSR